MAAPRFELEELDNLTVQVIVDNELDPISPGPTLPVQQSGGILDVALRHPLDLESRGGAFRELRMDGICCGAHGLSLLITGEKHGRKRTILFDTGPEEEVWQRNASRLRLKETVGSDLERIVLSHWHSDHSGGMLEVVRTVAGAQRANEQTGEPELVVDLHPNRPYYRGFKAPTIPPVSLEADPTFEEIEKAGARVEKNADAHTVLDNTFLVSGEIPRVTEYETGLRFGVRLNKETGVWEEDEKVADERFLMCRVKGKGIVMFTGCSHAGVANASKHAAQLGGGVPLYAVMGGFHLADAQPEKIQATIQDLKALDIQVLLSGHCTGWRAKFEIQKELPGRLMPSFVGSKFVF